MSSYSNSSYSAPFEDDEVPTNKENKMNADNPFDVNDETTDDGAVEDNSSEQDSSDTAADDSRTDDSRDESSDDVQTEGTSNEFEDAPATDAGGPLGNVTDAVTEPLQAPGNEERASRLSTGTPDPAESLTEDRYRQSSDEPYKDHGDRAEGPSSTHSAESVSQAAGYQEVAPGVQGRVSGQNVVAPSDES